MYLNLTKNLEKIFSEFNSLNKNSKSLIKYGSIISLLLLALGAIFLVLNNSLFNYDYHFELIARTIIKSSFTIFAEVIIGGLLIDYLLKRN